MPIRHSFAVSPIATTANAFAAGRRQQARYNDQLQLQLMEMQQRERLARMNVGANLFSQGASQNAAMQRLKVGAGLDMARQRAADVARMEYSNARFGQDKELIGLRGKQAEHTMQMSQDANISRAADEVRGKIEYGLGQLDDSALNPLGQEKKARIIQGIAELTENAANHTPQDRLFGLNELYGQLEALQLPRYRAQPPESMEKWGEGNSWINRDAGVLMWRNPDGSVESRPLTRQPDDRPVGSTVVDSGTGNRFIVGADGKLEQTFDMQGAREEALKATDAMIPETFEDPIYQTNENGERVEVGRRFNPDKWQAMYRMKLAALTPPMEDTQPPQPQPPQPQPPQPPQPPQDGENRSCTSRNPQDSVSSDHI